MSKIIDAIRRFRPGSTAEAELPGVLRRQEMLDRMTEVNPYRFPLGVAVDGAVAELDLQRDTHLLVAGPPGGGNSVAELGIVSHALEHPEAWEVCAVDPKRVEFSYLEGYPQARVAAEHEAIAAALREVVAEIERRFAEMEAAGARHIRELDPPPKRLLMVVDDLSEVLAAEEAEANRASLERIAAQGRAAGVHLVLATQRQGSADSAILRNVTGRLACGRMDRTASQATVGSEAAANLPALPGRAIYCSDVEASGYAEREVQLALTSADDLPAPPGGAR